MEFTKGPDILFVYSFFPFRKLRIISVHSSFVLRPISSSDLDWLIDSYEKPSICILKMSESKFCFSLLTIKWFCNFQGKYFEMSIRQLKEPFKSFRLYCEAFYLGFCL